MPRLGHSGAIIAQRKLLGSRDPPTSASLVAGTTGVGHGIPANFFLFLFLFFFETESHSVAQVYRAVAQSRLTVTSISWVKAILLPQPPK